MVKRTQIRIQKEVQHDSSPLFVFLKYYKRASNPGTRLRVCVCLFFLTLPSTVLTPLSSFGARFRQSLPGSLAWAQSLLNITERLLSLSTEVHLWGRERTEEGGNLSRQNRKGNLLECIKENLFFITCK